MYQELVSIQSDKEGISVAPSWHSFYNHRSSLIYFNSMPLFRLDRSPEKYGPLLKKKDIVHISPIINYLVGDSEHLVCMGGDAVRNLYLRGKRKYKTISLLAVLSPAEADRYSSILNNIISSSDGAFSLGCKYRVRKNRNDGSFRDIALVRYVIEPRLEGPEKLLYLFRPAVIEVDITTEQKFSSALRGEVI